MEVEPTGQDSFTYEVMEAELIEQGDVVIPEALIKQEPSVTPGQPPPVQQRLLNPEVGNIIKKQPTMSTGTGKKRTSLSDEANMDTIYSSLDLLYISERLFNELGYLVDNDGQGKEFPPTSNVHSTPSPTLHVAQSPETTQWTLSTNPNRDSWSSSISRTRSN